MTDTPTSALGLIKEILEDASLIDDENCWGYLISPSLVFRLREFAEPPTQPSMPIQPSHDPRVLDYARARGPFSRVYSGWCTCGWQGPERGDSPAVEADCETHLNEVNR